ncbi:hypothetical protein ACFODZ_15970 [Marinicella sediminis]|uniref:Anti-sigma factor n=1 Tax=Marinicella sediminis TaxID=1792834 RepID=A0ABV7JC95_9GAMM|nr:hypothetical protein [Marinicella sediminis]
MTSYQPAPDTAERYLQGKLSDSELAAYELWLADHPDELEVLELDLLMQEGLKRLHSNQVLTDPAVIANSLREKAWYWTPPLMVLAFLLGFFLHQGLVNNLEQRMVNALYVPVEVMRGNSELQAEIHLGKDDQDLVLMIPVDVQSSSKEALQVKLDGVMHSGVRVILVHDQTWLVLSRESVAVGQVLSIEQVDQNKNVVFSMNYLLVE